MAGTENVNPGRDTAPAPPPPPVPSGFRQGIITAITVLLGFSLALLRFWSLEAPGGWSLGSAASTGTMVASVVLQIITLFRSLRIEDDDVREYRQTVRWLIVSTVVLLVALLLTVIESSTTAPRV